MSPSCSVYACPDAAIFALLPDLERGVTSEIPLDCLCARHWLDLQATNPDRAYRYVSIRYILVTSALELAEA